MEDLLRFVLLWLRLIIYPALAYSIISLAIARKDEVSPRTIYAHVIASLFFLGLWVALIARRLFGVTGDSIQFFMDYVLTPLLVVLLLVVWRALVDASHKEAEEIITNEYCLDKGAT